MEIISKISISLGIIMVLTLMIDGIRCDTNDDMSRIDGEIINAKTLIKMGRRLNKPMLTVIGMAMKNQHRCSAWTEWTECSARISNFFGVRNRSRECILVKTKPNKSSEEETDFSLCEGKKIRTVCPNTYNMTTNGFCIKLQVTRKNHDDAEAECNEDGGHLININSDLKFADVKTVLTGFSVADINIGGRRQSSTSQWEYKYDTNNGFITWYPGYPKSDTSKSCLALENLKWWNLSCDSKWPFLCEIPQ